MANPSLTAVADDVAGQHGVKLTLKGGDTATMRFSDAAHGGRGAAAARVDPQRSRIAVRPGLTLARSTEALGRSKGPLVEPRQRASLR